MIADWARALLVVTSAMTPQDALAQVRSARQEGQGLAEYALILALIAIVAIAALGVLGSSLNKVLSTVGKSI